MPLPPPDALNVQPDAPDFRDRLYAPALRLPGARFNNQPYARAEWREAVLNQGASNACTGFALAAMVHSLCRARFTEADGTGTPPPTYSPWMLYYFARRYDEFAGEADAGSSARAAMKAWHKHGAATQETWTADFVDVEPPETTWIREAFETPLGAYFRVDHTCIPDLHAAINETGAVYATAQIHGGWAEPADGEIPFTDGEPPIGGHAFLMVGYDERGFWIQNSWGPDWGRRGFARLSYRDWRCHSMDAWVAQLGVTIAPAAEDLGVGLNPSSQGGPVRLSSNRVVRDQQLNPYVVNLANNGRLSDSGAFRTRPSDLGKMVGQYLDQALARWSRPETAPIDVAIYAHGGLTPEAAAADTAARWIPALFEAQVFPVFLMWETGLMETVRNILDELVRRQRAAGGPWLDRALDWKDDRIDALVSGPGTAVWEEMKENAAQAVLNSNGGLHALYACLKEVPAEKRARLRFHLVGHSAGCIFHAHLLRAMQQAGLRVDGCYFMAPACKVDLFQSAVLAGFRHEQNPLRAYVQFHLDDFFEQRDTCTPVYNRSLLYMVSNAFERRRGTPILGMEKHLGVLPETPPAAADVWDWIEAPTRGLAVPDGARSEAFTHGGFDNDTETMRSVVHRIRARAARPL